MIFFEQFHKILSGFFFFFSCPLGLLNSMFKDKISKRKSVSSTNIYNDTIIDTLYKTTVLDFDSLFLFLKNVVFQKLVLFAS